jgi:sec-independent protein translocase protein TatB
MFDVGFSEMLLVGLIALLVFGPERLPKVARQAALWVKKARAMASSVKQEIDRELQLQELKETLDQQKRQMDQIMLVDKLSLSPPPELESKPKVDPNPQEGSHE